MVNRHDGTPEINDYTYYVFSEIENRGLQFAIPDKWRPLYRAFLRERKRREKVTGALRGIAQAFATERSNTASYSQDFGNNESETPEENPQAD